MRKLLFIFIGTAMFFAACKKDPAPAEELTLKDGVFIVNQGNFTVGNASLSYLEPGNFMNDIFYQVNQVPLGDVAQSITIHKNTAFIVVNNSRYIYGIDKQTAEVSGKISGLSSPRHMLVINDQKAYVSDLFDYNVAIVNPSTYEVTGQIPVGRTTEEMVLINNEAFVANWSGYNQPLINNKVIVIDTDQDKMVDSVTVGIEPNSIITDKNNNLWVLCSGGYDMETKVKATLWKIDPANRQVLDSLVFDELTMYPDNLEISGAGDTLFFVNQGIFSMSINDTELPADPFIVQVPGRNYEFLGVDPVNGNLYASDPLNYIENGKVYQFNSFGNYLNVYDAGIVPGAFGFNY